MAYGTCKRVIGLSLDKKEHPPDKSRTIQGEVVVSRRELKNGRLAKVVIITFANITLLWHTALAAAYQSRPYASGPGWI